MNLAGRGITQMSLFYYKIKSPKFSPPPYIWSALNAVLTTGWNIILKKLYLPREALLLESYPNW